MLAISAKPMEEWVSLFNLAWRIGFGVLVSNSSHPIYFNLHNTPVQRLALYKCMEMDAQM